MPYRLAFTPSGRKAGRALFREMLRGIKMALAVCASAGACL